MSASDSTADVSGRRSRASQPRLSMPQVRAKAACASRLGLEREQNAECRGVNGDEERNPGGISEVGGREAVLQVQDGGRHDSGHHGRSLATVTGAERRHISVIEPSWQGRSSKRSE